MSSEDLSDVLRQTATEPRSVSVDGTNVQAVFVADVIAADKHLRARESTQKNHLGLHFRKLIPSD
jgi:hypothetical protein